MGVNVCWVVIVYNDIYFGSYDSCFNGLLLFSIILV